MILSKSATHIINDMQQGEIAATETYQQALDQVGDEPGADDLRTIHGEHREAANRLRQFVRDFGGTPSQSSQTWGVFAKVVEGVAKVLGDSTALKALKAGEERGLSNYREALSSEHLPAGVISYLRTTLVPQTEAHIGVLDRLLNARRG